MNFSNKWIIVFANIVPVDRLKKKKRFVYLRKIRIELNSVSESVNPFYNHWETVCCEIRRLGERIRYSYSPNAYGRSPARVDRVYRVSFLASFVSTPKEYPRTERNAVESEPIIEHGGRGRNVRILEVDTIILPNGDSSTDNSLNLFSLVVTRENSKTRWYRPDRCIQTSRVK